MQGYIQPSAKELKRFWDKNLRNRKFLRDNFGSEVPISYENGFFFQGNFNKVSQNPSPTFLNKLKVLECSFAGVAGKIATKILAGFIAGFQACLKAQKQLTRPQRNREVRRLGHTSRSTRKTPLRPWSNCRWSKSLCRFCRWQRQG